MTAEDRTPTLRTKKQRIGHKTAVAGGSVKDMAKAAKVSTGTAQGWLSNWRKELGDDYLRDERQIERAARTEAAREASQRMWTEFRTTVGANLGAAANQGLQHWTSILPTVGTVRVDRGKDGKQPPIVVAGPKGADAKALAEAITKFVETAELVDGNPTRHTRRSVPSDQYDPRGLPEPEDDEDQVRGRVINLLDVLRERKTGTD